MTAANRKLRQLRRVSVTTLLSPCNGHSGASANAALREAGGEAAIEDHILPQPHLGTKAHGILPAECTPVRRDRELLVRRQDGAAECNRNRGSLERLLDLCLQGGDVGLQGSDVGLQNGDVLRRERRR